MRRGWYIHVRTGYKMVLSSFGRPVKYIPEHRLIAQDVLGRPLEKNEVVHHVNGDRLDNRNENLLICDASYHIHLERKMAELYKKEHFKF